MTLEQFNSLNLNDRAEYLWENGDFLNTMAIDGYTVKLYSLSKLFIEVYATSNGIAKIEVVSGDGMNKYLGGISL